MRISRLLFLFGVYALLESLCSRDHSKFIKKRVDGGRLDEYEWFEAEHYHFLVYRFLGLVMILLGLWGIVNKNGVQE